jgi:hypothetical protein
MFISLYDYFFLNISKHQSEIQKEKCKQTANSNILDSKISRLIKIQNLRELIIIEEKIIQKKLN